MKRDDIHPGIHSDPCRVVDGGILDFQEKEIRNGIAHARLIISEVKAGLICAQGGIHPRDDARNGEAENGIYIHASPNSITLEIRRPDLDDVHIEIRGSHRTTDRLIAVRPRSRVKPVDAAARIVDAAEMHLDGLIRRPLTGSDLDAHREVILAIAAHLRHQGEERLKPGAELGCVEAATPWSPLQARVFDESGQCGADILTPTERRKWTGPPVVEVDTRLSSRWSYKPNAPFSLLQGACLVIKPFSVGPNQGILPPMDEMRRIATLNAPSSRHRKARP